jgi:hypothetical protein
MTTTKTAAGSIQVLSSARAINHGQATMFFGIMPDGRFVVTSRFEYYVRTNDRSKAEAMFASLVEAA